MLFYLDLTVFISLLELLSIDFNENELFDEESDLIFVWSTLKDYFFSKLLSFDCNVSTF